MPPRSRSAGRSSSWRSEAPPSGLRYSDLNAAGRIITAHVVLTAPYVVLLMSLAIRAFDVRIEQIAMTLGASRLEMMVRVLLPNILPNAAAAWLFAFVISFDEVVVTLFVSGSHLTVPKRMFNQLVLQINPTITAIATILIFLSLASVALALWLSRGTGMIAKR